MPPGPASAQWRSVADQIRPKLLKLVAIKDASDSYVLASMTLPKEHRAKLHSTNPIERLDCEIKHHTEVMRTFPNDDSITSIVGPTSVTR